MSGFAIVYDPAADGDPTAANGDPTADGASTADGERETRDELLSRVLATMRHRGKDPSARAAGPFALGMLNRAEAPHFRAGTGRAGPVTVLLEGWLENEAEVLARYGSGGAPAPERIAAAVREDGPGTLAELRGDYVVVAVRARSAELYALRDPRGLRPACFWSDGERFVMASEVKGVLAHPAAPRDLDRDVLGHLLVTGLEPYDRSLARHVRKLPPGHLLEWRAGEEPTTRQLESLIVPPRRYDLETATERLDAGLESGLRQRLEDKPSVGILLSGGVDSYLLARTAGRLFPDRVRTATTGVDAYDLDETEEAARLARRLELPHRAVRWSRASGGSTLLELLRHSVRATEQPGRFANAPMTVHLLDRWRGLPPVILTGDSADGLMGEGGYRRFDRVETLRKVPFRHALGGMLEAVSSNGDSRVTRLAEMLRMRRHDFRLFGAETFEHSRAGRLLGFDPEERIQEDYRGLVREAGDCTPSQLFCYVERRTEGQGVIDKLERLVSAAGSDLIHPFLMPEIVRLGFEMPSRLKYRGGKTKLVPRALAGRTLPDEIVWQEKIGFAAPRIRWLTDDDSVREGITRLTSQDAPIAGRVDRGTLREAVEAYRRAPDEAPLDTLWVLLSADLWCRELGI